jgi:hypothetical protein
MDNDAFVGSMSLSAILSLVFDLVMLPDKLNIISSVINIIASFSTVGASSPAQFGTWASGWLMGFMGILIYLAFVGMIEAVIGSVINSVGGSGQRGFSFGV